LFADHDRKVPMAKFTEFLHLALLRRRLDRRFGGVSAAYRHTNAISPIKRSATIPAPSYMLCSPRQDDREHLNCPGNAHGRYTDFAFPIHPGMTRIIKCSENATARDND